MIDKSSVRVGGSVESGFEAVEDLFRSQFETGQEANAQICVYVAGKKVVDLFGTSVADVGYDQETLQTIFSSTKTLAAIVFASLVDRGCVNYDDKVAQHWPAFAKKEKANLRICDVLRHEAGLVYLNDTVNVEDMYTESVKNNCIGKIVEDSEPCFPPEETKTDREYHALTWGFILNEIFRRTDPEGRTMSEYLRDVLCPSLGVDAYIGLTPEQQREKTVSDLRALTVRKVAIKSLVPRLLGRKIEANAGDLFTSLRRLKRKQKEIALKRPPAIEGKNMIRAVAIRWEKRDGRGLSS